LDGCVDISPEYLVDCKADDEGNTSDVGFNGSGEATIGTSSESFGDCEPDDETDAVPLDSLQS
jgi:hypothetical protein